MNPKSSRPLLGVSLVMFLSFVGFSSSQFHGYLFERMGYSPLRIGFLLFAGFVAGIVAPPLQVQAMRWLQGPQRPLLWMFFIGAVGMALLPLLGGFYATMGLFFVCIFCTSSIPPLNIACTLEVTRSRGQWLYFVVRGIGTVGYLAGCLISYFFPRPEFLSRLYLGFGVAFFLALLAAALNFRFNKIPPAPEKIVSAPNLRLVPNFRRGLRLLSAPRPRRLLWTLGGMNFANAMATLVQGNYLVDRFAGGQQSISEAWVFSTTCEIPLMLFCAYLVRRAALRTVLGLGLLGTALKLILIGVAETRWVYFLGLALHGCFFSGALSGFNLYLDQRFSVADRPVLQALGALFYQGLPLACGGLVAGILWHFLGLRSIYWTACWIGAMVGVYTLFLLPQLPAQRNS